LKTRVMAAQGGKVGKRQKNLFEKKAREGGPEGKGDQGGIKRISIALHKKEGWGGWGEKKRGKRNRKIQTAPSRSA